MSNPTADRPIIPVIDLGQIGLGHTQEPIEYEWQRFAKEITDAFRNVGFVYLKNHGIPEDLTNRLVKAGGQFFDLPLSDKQRYNIDPKTLHGYVGVDAERLDLKYSKELRESFNFVGEKGLFPDDSIPDLRLSSTEFLVSCKNLTYRILLGMAIGLGIPRNFFLDAHRYLGKEGNSTIGRLLHYPPIPEGTSSSDTIRCGAHSDFGTITLLFQDNMGGLQVQNASGHWVNADPIPGTVLINAGDLLQFWTSNKLKATKHRVVVPEEEIRQRKSRRSFAYFVQADDAVLIKPLDGSADFTPITSKEYLDQRVKAVYQ